MSLEKTRLWGSGLQEVGEGQGASKGIFMLLTYLRLGSEARAGGGNSTKTFSKTQENSN